MQRQRGLVLPNAVVATDRLKSVRKHFATQLVTYLHWERLSKLTLGILGGPGDAGSLPDGHSVLCYASVLF